MENLALHECEKLFPNGCGRNLFRDLHTVDMEGELMSSVGCSAQRLFAITLCMLLVAVCGRTAFAQTGSATLSGTVFDAKGAVVPDVEVSITSSDTNVTSTTKTNGSGIYVLEGLKPGRYRVFVSKTGFKQITLTDVVLNTQDSVSRNFDLVVGATSETITVNANAEHMETDNSAVGLLVSRDFVENMPLNGRSLEGLIALAPGAVTGTQGYGFFSINGQREDANYFTIDGVPANLNANADRVINSGFSNGLAGTLPSQTALGTSQSLVSLDTIQEFTIQTSGSSAESGRQPGGQIELTTRSGTNDLHASVFDYFRNDALDANNWAANAAGQPREPERQNDFGGTIGGPFRIPRIYNGKDKTFYFVSYEGLRLRLPGFATANVPTPEFRQFAAPALQPFLKAFPLPSAGHAENGDQCALSLGFTFSCSALSSFGFSSPSTLNATSVRVDQRISSTVQLFARYSNTPSQASLYDYGHIGEIFNTTDKVWGWTVGVTISPTSRMTDELRFNYSNSSGEYSISPSPLGGATVYPLDALVPREYIPTGGGYWGDMILNLPGDTFPEVPKYQKIGVHQHQYSLINNTSIARGSSLIQFGVDYRRLSPLVNPIQYETNFFLESPQEVQQGYSSTASIAAARPAYPIYHNLSLYARNHHKVSSKLTLDYGIRWEYNPVPGATNGLYPVALTTGNPATATLAPVGTPQYKTVYDDFAPRFGFAYQPYSVFGRSFVVRGGFGIFYDTGQAGAAQTYGAYPFFNYTRVTNVSFPLSPVAVAPPSLNIPLIPPYGYMVLADPNLKVPYTEQWNVSIDQQLSNKNTLTVSYVGNAGKKLLYVEAYATSANPAFSNGLQLTNNRGASNYEALDVQDSGYVAPGLQVVASYVWAHAIDNVSTDTYSPEPLRGNSDNDVRHVFNIAANYEIPESKSSRLARALTHGWLLANRVTLLSGYPFNIYQGFVVLPNGTEELFFPDLKPGVSPYRHDLPGFLGGWSINPSAFSPVPTDPTTGFPERQGSLPRNGLHGPGFWSLDTSLQRNFVLRDKLTLNFRVDAFNLLNHPNASIGNIDTIMSDPTFGQFLGGGGAAAIGTANPLYATGAARSLQISLKLQF